MIVCGLCKCETDAPPVASGTVLCARCAAVPVLVAAYREGRARLAEFVDPPVASDPQDERFASLFATPYETEQ